MLPHIMVGVFGTRSNPKIDKTVRKMSYPLPTYLRTFRRRSGFTQDELSFLLDVGSDQGISRLERRHGTPNAKIVIASEVAFGVSAEEVFPRFHGDIHDVVLERAAILYELLGRKTRTAEVDLKLSSLRRIVKSANVHNGT